MVDDDSDKDAGKDVSSNEENALNTLNSQKISVVEFDDEMRKSYLDYSMSVIVGRALPDVRDGLKPVHRRVIYGMYAGRYYVDRNTSRKQYYKCARVVGDVMGNYHPHGDTAIYDTLVRMGQNWNLRYTLVEGQGNFGSRGDSKAAAMRYTECLMDRLALEMVRDIDKETVEFEPTYDQRSIEPTVLPSRFPNLIVNGSQGIAVGMATNIPTHNLREIAEGINFYLDHYEMPREELLENLIQIIPGPDFPTGAQIIGRSGIESAYRTGKGSVLMRGVTEIVETEKKTQIIIKELPYQVNPDTLLEKIQLLINNDVVPGLQSCDDLSSARTGLNIVLNLKKDAVAKVVLNNLYKHTQLQETFGCNMLALVDGVPRTLSLDLFLKYWIEHQLQIIEKRSIYIQKKAQERKHILEGYLKALEKIDAVIKLIRASDSVENARDGLIDLLKIDIEQAKAILAMQLSRLAHLEHQKIIDEDKELLALINEMQSIVTSPEKQREIIKSELNEIVDTYGDERKTQIMPAENSLEDEAYIKEEEVVITITKDGFIKRTNLELYRSQKRGGKGVKGAKLKEDDLIEHFFATTTHNYLLFFTNTGRMYQAKGYQIPQSGRDSKGSHISNVLELAPDEKVVSILAIENFEVAPYLVLATKSGKIKKSKLTDYQRRRSGGIKAIDLKEYKLNNEVVLDEVVSAKILNDEQLVLMVSKNGSSLIFDPNKINSSTKIAQLKVQGRTTSGAIGMRFRPGDYLLSFDVVDLDSKILIVTSNGYAKKTSTRDYLENTSGEIVIHGKGGKGKQIAKFDDKRGELVDAIVVNEDDELLVIMKSGKVVRGDVDLIKDKSRVTKGVIFARVDEDDEVISITKNYDRGLDSELD